MSNVVEGILDGYNNKFESSDGLLINGKWHNVAKGTAKGARKGDKVTLSANTVTKDDGKTYTNYSVVSVDKAGNPNPPAHPTRAKFGSSAGGDTGNRNQPSIVFQSSLKVAQEFEARMAAETKGMNDGDSRAHREKAYKQLLSTAFSLARVAINPSLDKPQAKKEEAEPSHAEMLEVVGGP